MDQIKIGIFLKELRKEKKLTQEQLAEKLNVSGRTVSRWETGSNMPDIGMLKLKKLPKIHAYITSNMKIKDLLEVSLWLRTSLIPNAVITISLTSSCHIQVHRLLENMAECVERFWNRTNQCFLTT